MPETTPRDPRGGSTKITEPSPKSCILYAVAHAGPVPKRRERGSPGTHPTLAGEAGASSRNHPEGLARVLWPLKCVNSSLWLPSPGDSRGG